jgi:hypothetical protein
MRHKRLERKLKFRECSGTFLKEHYGNREFMKFNNLAQ